MREKNRRKKEKEAGNEHVVRKRKKIVEDHHDDCGEDISSLRDKATVDLVYPCDFDSEDALSDEDRDQCLRLHFGSRIQSYPVDASRVARAHPGGPGIGPDLAAPAPKASKCPGCRHSRSKDDWEHTREIGQCRYPYDEPWIPECRACQDRKPRHHHEHTFEHHKCKWATARTRNETSRTKHSSGRPHEPEPKLEQEPTAGIPANVEGRELGADGEEQVAREDRAAGQAASSSRGRGPDQEPRERRTYRDQGDNPEAAHNWSNFVIGRVVRIFRTNCEAAIRLPYGNYTFVGGMLPNTLCADFLNE